LTYTPTHAVSTTTPGSVELFQKQRQESFRGRNPGGAPAVLHQPLKRTNFVKNGHFARNMNGIPVSLFWKTENAPTRGPRKANFRTPVWAATDGCWAGV